jgi:uncharacterized protein
MRKILLGLSLLFSCNLHADLVADGIVEAKKGNYTKGNELFSKACDGGAADGCYVLALSYTEGRGARQDYTKANELFSVACDGRAAMGCVYLGHDYANGLGVRRNESQAKALYGQACDLGDQMGCDNYRKLNEAGVQ